MYTYYTIIAIKPEIQWYMINKTKLRNIELLQLLL